MKFVWIGFITFMVLIGVSAWVIFQSAHQPGKNDLAVPLTIQKGEGVKDVADALVKAGVITQRWHWNVYVVLNGDRSSILSGDYTIPAHATVAEIIQLVTTPPDKAKEVTVKLLEGWTSDAMADVLDRAGVIKRQDFLDAVDQANVATLLPDKSYAWLADKPATASLEGYLFPDTYRFFYDSTPAQVIGKMLDNFNAKYTTAMQQVVKTSGRTNFEAITLASIVERELKTDQDRAMAADLFLRRIEAGIPLQSDATVNYVTGKSALQPTIADTQIDSPYNTYKYPGLPPGPISNPGLSALRASVYPQANPYYYFLTVDQR